MIKIASMCNGQFDIIIDDTQKYEVPYFYVIDRETGKQCCIQVNGPAYLETEIPNMFLTPDQKRCLVSCLKRNAFKGMKCSNWQYMIEMMCVCGYKYLSEYTKMSMPYYQYL